MSKSMILTANTTSETITAGNIIPVGSIVRRYGCGYTVDPNEITISQPGYYTIDVNTAFTGTTGDVVLDVLKGGTPIPGTTVTETIGTATTASHVVTIPTAVRVYCNCMTPISVRVNSSSTATPTISQFSIRIVKV